MTHVPFYQTRTGRQFYEVTVPELVRQLTRLNDLLAARVEIMAQPSQKDDQDDGRT
ncbi:MAG: hypothetical protein R3D98_06465 [Candidatus Krumholzibacteriia bacterium]